MPQDEFPNVERLRVKNQDLSGSPRDSAHEVRPTAFSSIVPEVQYDGSRLDLPHLIDTECKIII